MFRIRDYSVLLPLTPGELDLLFSRRRQEGDCIIWTGPRDSEGYGRIKLRGQVWLVHRLIHEILLGHVPTDLVVHHGCENRLCCNPEHFELSTNADNVRRAKRYCGIHHHNGRRTHCKRGHPLYGPNCITRYSKGRYARVCRACLNMRRRAYRAARRAAGSRWTGDAHFKSLMSLEAQASPPPVARTTRCPGAAGTSGLKGMQDLNTSSRASP